MLFDRINYALVLGTGRPGVEWLRLTEAICSLPKAQMTRPVRIFVSWLQSVAGDGISRNQLEK